MIKHARLVPFILLLSLFGNLPAAASQNETTVTGEVVQVQQRVRTQNDGELDQIKIRTRHGQEMQLQMGRGESCPGCFQVGDQIRARVRSGDNGQAARVQSMKVRREGSMYSYRFQNGQLTQNQERNRDGSGAGRNNQRQGQRDGNGSGNCRGNGGGSRGGGGG